ncbi:MAG: hypothetical protein AB7T27_09430 [Kiritimatiellia bacterium]
MKKKETTDVSCEALREACWTRMQKRLAANEESGEYHNSIRSFSCPLHFREKMRRERKFPTDAKGGPRMEEYSSFLHELHALNG